MLTDALHTSDMRLMVILVNYIVKADYSICFEEVGCQIRNKWGETIGSIPANKCRLYKVEHLYLASTMPEKVELFMLHQHLRHISANTIHTLIHTHAVEGLQLIDDSFLIICDLCKYAKTMYKAIHKECTTLLTEHFGNEIHSDVWGLSSINTIGGWCYYATFTDDYSSWT